MTQVDTVWLLVCTILVLLMQAGFACLECGLVRAKNSLHVAAKNLTDLLISSLLFWAIGFAMVFGVSAGGIVGSTDIGLSLSDPATATSLGAFFFFQLAFCSTATTIVSGATAERITFAGYAVVCALVSGVIYPLFGHWAWGGARGADSTGWLQALGFLDFAGSTVVHSIGGWVSLALVMILGPRLGRFGPGGKAPVGCNPALSIIGAMLLWIGWFGFNGGSTLALTPVVPQVLVNTLLGGSAGGVAAIAISWYKDGRPDPLSAMNGSLAGLVAITASANIVGQPSAILIGAVGGIVHWAATRLLERLQIDDTVGAVPVHLGAGIWGTLAVAILGDSAAFGGHDRLTQFGIQCLGVAAAAVLAFSLAYGAGLLIKRFMTLRVSEEAEREGLSAAEHGIDDGMGQFLRELDRQRQTGDFSQSLDADAQSEAGRIAQLYELVRARFNDEVANREAVTQQLQESEQRFKTLLANIPGVCYRCAADAAYTMEFISDAVEELTGYPASDFIANRKRTFASIIHPDDEGLVGRAVEEALAEKRPFTIEYRIQHRDGSLRWVHERGRGVFADDRSLLHLDGAIFDSTDRRRLEAELAETHQMATFGVIAATVSHELRNPLGAIRTSLSFVRQTAGGQSEGLDRAIERMDRCVDRCTGIIADLLEYSDPPESRRVPTNIDDWLAERLRDQAKRHGVRIEADFGADEMVAIDPERFAQVIDRLIDNAAQAMDGPNWDPPADHPRRVTVTTEVAGPHVRLLIADTGPGIPAWVLPKIFDPLFTTRSFGAGLGLPITRRIVEQHGGAIAIDSTEGEGATATIWLPRSEAAGEDLPDDKAVAA
jgi:Amt family ammonium transporter